MVTYSIYPHHFILGELSIRTWKMDLAKPSGHIPKSSQIYQSQNSIPKWLLILSVIYPIFHANLPMIFPEIGGWFFSEGPNGVPGAHWAVRSDIGHPIGGDWNIWIMTFPSYWEWKIIPTDIYWDIYWAIYWDIYGIFIRYLSDLSGYFLSVQKKHGDLMWFGSSLRLRVGEQTDHGCFCWYEKLQKIDGYGSIPINTIFSGMNIHKSQLFDVNYRGTRVLTHCQIIPPQIAWRGFTNVKRGRDSSHQTSQLYCIIKNKRDYIWLYMVIYILYIHNYSKSHNSIIIIHPKYHQCIPIIFPSKGSYGFPVWLSSPIGAPIAVLFQAMKWLNDWRRKGGRWWFYLSIFLFFSSFFQQIKYILFDLFEIIWVSWQQLWMVEHCGSCVS